LFGIGQNQVAGRGEESVLSTWRTRWFTVVNRGVHKNRSGAVNPRLRICRLHEFSFIYEEASRWGASPDALASQMQSTHAYRERDQASPTEGATMTTNFTTRMMIAAATLVVAAGSASAQVMNAEIPFTFRAGGTVMAPGKYIISTSTAGGRPVYRVRSYQEPRSILLLPGAANDPQKAWVASGNPVLSFECGVGHCALATIWTGGSVAAYSIPHPKLGRDEPVHTALVVMRPEKGD
jgi:hypothetical protein